MIDPSALSPTAAEALAAAGWTPATEVDADTLAKWRLRYTVAYAGLAVDETVPCWNEPAQEFLRSLGGLLVPQSGPGVDLARNTLEFNPLLLLHWTRLLATRAAALGTVLAPLGVVENGAAIAVDSERRIALVDHTGEWFFEPGLERGLSDLIDGVLPAERLAL